MIAEEMGKISTRTEEVQSLLIEPASLADIGGLVELLNLKRPTAWIKKISLSGLKRFLEYSIDNPRSIILLARSDNDNAAGYVFSTIDTGRFWLGFALRHPATMLAIMYYRLRNIVELKIQRKNKTPEQEGDAHLPGFSWSPNGPGAARIVGILVRKEHRGKGVATKLYYRLFEALKEKKCVKVEEYMGPDYDQFAGKFHNCGWDLQQLRGAGYKMTKLL